MAQPNLGNPPPTSSRPVGGTENGWCKAVQTGTGATVLAVLFNKTVDSSLLHSALHGLLSSHPMIRSKLHYDARSNSFSIVTPSEASRPDIAVFDVHSTSEILQRSPHSGDGSTLSGFHVVLQHELNRNPWKYPDQLRDSEVDVFHATLYAISEKQCVLALRLHIVAFDCAGAVVLFRTLMKILAGEGVGTAVGVERVSPAIEDLLPRRKVKKALWSRGVNLLGYSLSSLRMENLNFVDARSGRSSEVVRFKIKFADTQRLITGCKSRGMKLCGVLSAAALMAARSTKNLSTSKKEKYGVVTLMDCRSDLDPPLSSNSLGSYHSAILSSVDVTGKESLWDLAIRIDSSYTTAKNNNKHFSDMADLNFLMCKAIDNPGLTPSSSLRTAVLTVYENPFELHDLSDPNLQLEIGMEDSVICSSAHGIGPSMALFHSIRDGELDCVCVYPSPLHSMEQMKTLMGNMRRFLVDNNSP